MIRGGGGEEGIVELKILNSIKPTLNCIRFITKESNALITNPINFQQSYLMNLVSA